MTCTKLAVQASSYSYRNSEQKYWPLKTGIATKANSTVTSNRTLGSLLTFSGSYIYQKFWEVVLNSEDRYWYSIYQYWPIVTGTGAQGRVWTSSDSNIEIWTVLTASDWYTYACYKYWPLVTCIDIKDSVMTSSDRYRISVYIKYLNFYTLKVVPLTRGYRQQIKGQS